MKKKIISLILISILLIFSFQIYSTGFDYSSQVDKMMKGDGNEKVLNPVNNISGTAITVAQIIAVGVAIIMLLVLAMKYMISAPEDRATIKKHAVVYVVGAIIMFSTTGILGIIKQLAKSFS